MIIPPQLAANITIKTPQASWDELYDVAGLGDAKKTAKAFEKFATARAAIIEGNPRIEALSPLWYVITVDP